MAQERKPILIVEDETPVRSLLKVMLTEEGFEVVEGPDGYNDNASRSFLFGFALPITHTGLRVTYPFSDAFSCRSRCLSNAPANASDARFDMVANSRNAASLKPI